MNGMEPTTCSTRVRGTALVLGLLLMPPAQANPTGATVEHGAATFDQQGAVLTVTNRPGTIIHWQGFSIDAHETTRFLQENAASAVLNRIGGGAPSVILGQLQSNGQVWLINPNGVLFGAGARIDVGALVASSLDIRDGDFLAGRGLFSGDGMAGQVRNDGLIRTGEGGAVMLIAPSVDNHGVIVTPGGQVLLAAGHAVDVAEVGNPALRVHVAAGGEVLNVGQLLAEGGALGMHAALVREAGVVRAGSVVVDGDRVFLRAGDGASAEPLGEHIVTVNAFVPPPTTPPKPVVPDPDPYPEPDPVTPDPVVPPPPEQPEPTIPEEPVPDPRMPNQGIVTRDDFLQRELPPPRDLLGTPDARIDADVPAPAIGGLPWNSQFEAPDRPNVCRLLCK